MEPCSKDFNSLMDGKFIFKTFGYLGRDDLNRARLVCALWRKLADRPDLWQALLDRMKGAEFTVKTLLEPRNFLILDQEITREIKALAASNEEDSLKAVFRRVENVVFECLDTRVFYFKDAASLIISYHRISAKAVGKIKKASCLKRESWQKVVREVALELFSMPLHPQRVLASMLNRGNRIVAKYLEPDTEMEELIKKYGILDIFNVQEGDVVIHAYLADQMDPYLVFDASVEEGDDVNKFNYRLWRLFLESQGLPSERHEALAENKVKLRVDLKDMILNRLQDPATEMKEFLKCWFLEAAKHPLVGANELFQEFELFLN